MRTQYKSELDQVKISLKEQFRVENAAVLQNEMKEVEKIRKANQNMRDKLNIKLEKERLKKNEDEQKIKQLESALKNCESNIKRCEKELEKCKNGLNTKSSYGSGAGLNKSPQKRKKNRKCGKK